MTITSTSNPPNLHKFFSNNAQWSLSVEGAEPGFFAESAKGQAPEILWVGCADSRVPESVITASRPGDIFVHRNIANQFHLDDDSAQSVINYAVNYLGIKHVVVVGHTQCGGVAASLAASSAPPSTGSPSNHLARWLSPLTDLARSLDISNMPPAEALPILVEENVKRQVANVAKSETILQAWSKGEPVWIHGWVFDIAQGQLKDLRISMNGTKSSVEALST